MITRQWILITVIVMQVPGLLILAVTLFQIRNAGFLGYGVLADIGLAFLMFWVSASHLILLRRYKALRQRVSQ